MNCKFHIRRISLAVFLLSQIQLQIQLPLTIQLRFLQDQTNSRLLYLEIEIGSSVKWINSDNQMHSVTSGSGPNDPDLGKYFNSGLQGPTALIRNGTSFEHQFNLGGEFVYFCQLHPNMTGTINVG